MEKNAVKKCGVALITLVIVVLFISLPVFYFVVEVPLLGVAIATVFYVALSILMIYYAIERFREIDEGLDDAVDDY